MQAKFVDNKDSNEEYEKIKELGNGLHAIVFLARHRISGDHFALKVSKKVRLRSKRREYEAAMMNEISILQSVNHEHVVKVIEAYRKSEEISLVLELLDGGELFEYISQRNIITEEDSRRYAKQILLGLDHLHSKYICHLDLKPENIMIRSQERHEAVIVDFSLSRVVLPGSKVQILQGTSEFIAPEVINYEYVSTMTDMWAYGVILYILLTGYSPFLGDNDEETHSYVMRGEVDYEIEQLKTISGTAISLMKELLIRKQMMRLTAAQCLQHKWFVCTDKQSKIKRRESIIDTIGFKKFVARTKWQEAIAKLREKTYFKTVLTSNDLPSMCDNLELQSSNRENGLEESPRTRTF